MNLTDDELDILITMFMESLRNLKSAIEEGAVDLDEVYLQKVISVGNKLGLKIDWETLDPDA